MRTIIPFSGGLDSTYLLWRTLTETDDEVTILISKAEHVPICVPLRTSKESRQESGRDNPAKPANWLAQNVRRFNVLVEEVSCDHETNVDIPSIGQLSVAMCATWCNEGRFDNVMVAWEHDNDGTLRGAMKDFRHGPSCLVSLETFKRIAKRGRIEFPLIAMNYSQAHAITELPTALFETTFSCDRGVGGAPCGECYKCCKRKFILDRLQAGDTPDDIAAFCRLKSTTPEGWVPMKIWLKEFVPEFRPHWDMETPPYPIPEYPTHYEVGVD